MPAIVHEGRHQRPSWAYVAATAGTLAMMLGAVVLREGEGATDPGPALLVFTVLGWLPLVVRSRWPVPVLITTVAISALQLLALPLLDSNWEPPVGIAAYQPLPIATAVAAFAVAVRRRGRRWAPGVVASIVLPLTSIAVSGDDHLWTALVMSNLILDGTAAGALIAGRRDRIVRDQQERIDMTRREVEAERLRIARELHDVLAHHLTLVNAQASVADYLVRTDPDAAATALAGMARHTRQALDELRATVGLLRHTDDTDDTDDLAGLNGTTAAGQAAGHPTGQGSKRSPLPTLARLPELLDAVRSAGLDVDLTTSGQPAELAPGADLAAYRIIQEAITNATKHAPDEPVSVDLAWTNGRLTIRVTNPVRATPERNTTGSGHGLIGMNERVRAAGGTLQLERPSDDVHQFVVTAELPAEPRAATQPATEADSPTEPT